jgi:hypothetical protein
MLNGKAGSGMARAGEALTYAEALDRATEVMLAHVALARARRAANDSAGFANHAAALVKLAGAPAASWARDRAAALTITQTGNRMPINECFERTFPAPLVDDVRASSGSDWCFDLHMVDWRASVCLRRAPRFAGVSAPDAESTRTALRRSSRYPAVVGGHRS